MRLSLLFLMLFVGCDRATHAREVDMAAIHVAIADALIEARTPPELPNDFEDRLTPRNGAGDQKRPVQSPLAHDADPLPSVDDGYLPRLIIYTAPSWCEPCRRLDKQIERLKVMTIGGVRGPWQGLIGTDSGNAIEIVDGSDVNSPEAERAKADGVTSWPTIIRLDKEGHETSRTSGVLTAEQLSQYQAGKWQPPKPRSTTSTGSGNGLHVHKCPSCFNEWCHSSESAGDVAAHSCPACGTVQWAIAYWGPVKKATVQLRASR